MEAAGNPANSAAVESTNEVVLFLPDATATVENTDPPKPELSEEELKKELQQLLDSQLDVNMGDSDEKHLLRSRDQMNEDTPDFQPEVIDKPSKGFSTFEIQAFMNTQIRKQHQQQIMDQQLDMQNDRSHHQQQHLILVTQNGDKIILIQNPSEVEGDDSEVTATEYHPPELSEAEEQEILRLHRDRQRMLVEYLDKLREQHKERLPSSVTTPSVPHMQPIKLVPFPTSNSEGETSFLDDSSQQMPELDESLSQKSRSKLKKSVKKRDGDLPKWIRPINNHLDLARKFSLRRAEKIDEVAKSFPSASESFESRCSKMRQDFINIEIAISRFQNTISKEMEEVNNQFKSFLRDYHLEGCLGEVETADEVDEFEYNLFDVEESDTKIKQQQKKLVKKSVVGVDDVQIITPSNVSVLPAPEIQDVSSSGPPPSDDPFEFRQEPEMDVSITNSAKSHVVSSQNSDTRRSSRSLRQQSRMKKLEESPKSPTRKKSTPRH